MSYIIAIDSAQVVYMLVPLEDEIVEIAALMNDLLNPFLNNSQLVLIYDCMSKVLPKTARLSRGAQFIKGQYSAKYA